MQTFPAWNETFLCAAHERQNASKYFPALLVMHGSTGHIPAHSAYTFHIQEPFAQPRTEEPGNEVALCMALAPL
jgi:hypothetical protein